MTRFVIVGGRIKERPSNKLYKVNFFLNNKYDIHQRFYDKNTRNISIKSLTPIAALRAKFQFSGGKLIKGKQLGIKF